MTTSNTIFFTGTAYTIESLEGLKGSQLVALHNEVAKVLDEPLVKRFADKKTAVKRTWKLLEALPAPKQAPVAPKKEPKMTETKEAPKKAAPAQPKARKGTNLSAPGHAPIACREGSKQALLLDALSQEGGVTMAELIEALSGGKRPWTEATVRSGFGWDMKQKGYGVRSSFDENGTERFHIVVPEGHTIPAHRPLKSAPKADARQGRLLEGEE